MRILVTNDDGIHAPGLGVLERVAAELSEDVWVVAPETDQSGSSHSLTINDPLRLREVDERRFAVRGTPTDCVIMGVRHILAHGAPDLVLSGVNRGHNLADDVTYSGTIAGAFEGSVLGIRSIALSQGYRDPERVPWEVGAHHGAKVVRRLMEARIPTSVVLNVNFPSCAPEDVRGIVLAVQGKRDQSTLKVDQRFDGRGNPYYWIGFEARKSDPKPGTDLRAVRDGYVSVTPLSLNMTDAAAHEALSRWLPAREEA